MKTNLLIAIYWVVIVLAFARAQAQDVYRDNAVVDVSVRAGLEEQAQQPPPQFQGSAKQRAALSSWSFQPARAPSAKSNESSSFSNFQPLRQVPASTGLPTRSMPNTVADPSAKRRFSTLMEKPNYLGILPTQFGYGSTIQPPAFTAPVSPFSPLPGSQGFSKLFDRNLLGPASNNHFSRTTHLADRRRASVWQHKPHATKSSDVLSTTVPLASKRR
jgi:hypothetical protein